MPDSKQLCTRFETETNQIAHSIFAIRDERGNYRGVVEVSQEVSEIQNLEGEKRLLDWE